MDDDNYMKNYGLMNIDNRVKLIVMFLNKAHYEKNKSNNAHLTTIENNLKHIKVVKPDLINQVVALFKQAINS